MAMVLITCQVENPEKWEEQFRTHGQLFRNQTIDRIDFGALKDNYVGAVFHVENLETYMKILDSPETAEAMKNDGVKRETVKVVVLDRRFDP